MTLDNPDRLFPSDTFTRGLAREFLENIEGLPIISPHGHCDPTWFSANKRFPDPAQPSEQKYGILINFWNSIAASVQSKN